MPAILYNDAWHVAALYDAAGNVVQFSQLVSGETGFEHEPVTQELTAGSYRSGHGNTLMLATPDWDGLAQLTAWVDNHTPVGAVALSRSKKGRNYRWTELRTLSEQIPNPKEQRSEGDGFMKVALTGYDIAPAQKRNLIHGASGTSMILPISGETLTLAATITGTASLTLRARNFAGTEIGVTTASFTDERGSVQLSLPANTWTVEWALGGGSDASLRADGQTEYLAG